VSEMTAAKCGKSFGCGWARRRMDKKCYGVWRVGKQQAALWWKLLA